VNLFIENLNQKQAYILIASPCKRA